MATSQALRLCPNLVLLPVNIPKYKLVSKAIFKIFNDYTDLVEPLSLDEAYLDVSASPHLNNCATDIAQEIRMRIAKQENLTASAGVAPNKLLAKIASDINKPDGLTVIKPQHIDAFIAKIPVKRIFGIGKVTAKKMQGLGIITCADAQTHSLDFLIKHFGKFGASLYNYCRGIDHRPVSPDRQRKSVSVEHTYPQDLQSEQQCLEQLPILFDELKLRLARLNNPIINKQFIKVKRYDFTQTTMETKSLELDFNLFESLLKQTYQRFNHPVRLLGLGVGLCEPAAQQNLPLFQTNLLC
jgi:DNA polymerase-4